MEVEFTHNELEQFTKSQLYILAQYLEVEVSEKANKRELVAILEKLVAPKETDIIENMSARVKRIYLQNRSE